MNIEKIKKLAEILNENELSRMVVSEGENKIILEKNTGMGADRVPEALALAPVHHAPVEEEPPSLYENAAQVKSPVVGVFYSAPAPDAPPFVSIGDRVKKGDVLCIIEAMKVMIEIASEYDGEIVDICLRNEDIVEFGQVLFKII